MPLLQSATNRTVLTILVVAGLFAAGHALHHTTSCFLLSFVIAYLLDPFVVLLQKRKLSRPRSIIVVYAILAILSVFFFYFLVPSLVMRWHALAPNIPLYLQKDRSRSHFAKSVA